MPTKPLDSFDFARTFEAATFTVEIEDYKDDQRYAFLVSGWTNLLDRVADLMFKPDRHCNDLDRWRAGCHAEILDHIGHPDQWQWATTSDMWPYKTSWMVGYGQPYQRNVTILRLFQNDDERAVFLRNFPGGRRPGEADDEDEPEAVGPISSRKAFDVFLGTVMPPGPVIDERAFRALSMTTVRELREPLRVWDGAKSARDPGEISRMSDALDDILVTYLDRLPAAVHLSAEDARAAWAQDIPNAIVTPSILDQHPADAAPLMIVRSLVRDYRAPLWSDSTSIQALVSRYEATGLFATATGTQWPAFPE